MDRLVDISKNETQKKILEDIITGKDFVKLLSYIEEYKSLKDYLLTLVLFFFFDSRTN